MMQLHDAAVMPSIPKEAWMPVNMPNQHVRMAAHGDVSRYN